MAISKKAPVRKRAGKAATRKRPGRPNGYTKAIAQQICKLLIEGESLRHICSDNHMPSMSTVFRWLRANDGFQAMYVFARQEQAEMLVDEIIDIADKAPATFIDNNGAKRIDPAAVTAKQLQINARKWIASKLKPKKYGDKIEVGGAEGRPIKHHVIYTIVSPDGSRSKLDKT